MKYRREIDGLRSIAVLPVILFHAGIGLFSGGFVGVDVFFVISGYLITTIIVQEQAQGSFTFASFYERRARRILPALFFIMLATIPFAWLWMNPSQLVDLGNSFIAVPLFSSNILFWLESDYFAPSSELNPLLHTWSLAVEEQYYILFPVLVLLLWRMGLKFILLALVLIALGSLNYALWLIERDPEANFYLLPSRFWELLIGSIVAIYLLYFEKTVRPLAAQVLSGLGLALILYAIFSFDDKTPFPSLYALVPTIGTALIILFATPQTFVAKLLSIRLAVGIGLISYSAYLWHQPIFAFARIRSVLEPSHELMLGLSLISILLAYLSWRFIEKPFRDKGRFSRSQIFLMALLVSLVLIISGYVVRSNDGFSNPEEAQAAERSDEYYENIVRTNHGLSRRCEGKLQLLEECRTSEEPEVMVWGDSFGMHIVEGLLASKEGLKLAQITKSGCGPVLDLVVLSKRYTEKRAEDCMAFNDAAAQWLKDNDSVRYVAMSSPFSQYISSNADLKSKENGVEKANMDIAYRYIIKTLDFIKAQGAQPVIFAPPPSTGKDIASCLVNASKYDEDLSLCDLPVVDYHGRVGRVISLLKKIEQKYPVIWFDDYLCDEKLCKAAIDGVFIYRDKTHLSYDGAAHLGKALGFYKLMESHAKSSN